MYNCYSQLNLSQTKIYRLDAKSDYSVEIKHFFVFVRRRRRLEGHPLQVRQKQDRGQTFILLLSQATVLPGSDAGSDVVKQTNQHFSSKNIRPRAPFGARFMGHVIRMWSAVCLEMPHLQFGEGGPHLCMDKWNRPTSVCRPLSFVQAHPNRPGTGPGYKNTEPESILTVLRIPFIVCPLRREDAKSGKV